MESNDLSNVPLARPVMASPIPPDAAMPYARLFNPLLLLGTPPRGAWLDAALITLTAVVAHYLPMFLATLLRSDTELPAIGWGMVAAKWLEAATVIGLLAYLTLRHGNPLAAHGLHSDRPLLQFGWGILALIAVYGFMLATVLVIAAFMQSMPNANEEIQRRIEFAQNIPTSNTPLIATLMAAVAIHEELLFRGLLLPLLRRATGHWWIAIGLSSVIFGVLHITQGWLAVAQITCVSLIFSLAFILSRSLPAVIMAHFLFNFIQVQLMRLLPDLLDSIKDLDPSAAPL